MQSTGVGREDLTQQICLTVHSKVAEMIRTELQHVETQAIKEILDLGESSVLVKLIRERLENEVAQRAADLLLYTIAFQFLSENLSIQEYLQYCNKMLDCIKKVVGH